MHFNRMTDSCSELLTLSAIVKTRICTADKLRDARQYHVLYNYARRRAL